MSIPAVRDRVVQAAVKIVLEPVFEADFLPCSFGFRPKRAAHDGLQVLVNESFAGARWVVETDVADCFGAIPHSGLMSAVEERISDRRLLSLLRAFLRAGVMEQGTVRRPVTGTAQGGGPGHPSNAMGNFCFDVTLGLSKGGATAACRRRIVTCLVVRLCHV